MSKVLDEHSAEFVPASGIFGEYIDTIIPMPPYIIKEEQSFEDWMANGDKKP